MNYSTFDAEEICKVISACRKARVSFLELGAMKVVFASNPSLEGVSPGASPWSGILRPGLKQATIAETELNEAEGHAIASRETALRQEQVEELLLTDPATYEDLRMRGQLKDDEETGE